LAKIFRTKGETRTVHRAVYCGSPCRASTSRNHFSCGVSAVIHVRRVPFALRTSAPVLAEFFSDSESRFIGIADLGSNNLAQQIALDTDSIRPVMAAKYV
jgi:hypothetical protein